MVAPSFDQRQPFGFGEKEDAGFSRGEQMSRMENAVDLILDAASDNANTNVGGHIPPPIYSWKTHGAFSPLIMETLFVVSTLNRQFRPGQDSPPSRSGKLLKFRSEDATQTFFFFFFPRTHSAGTQGRTSLSIYRIIHRIHSWFISCHGLRSFPAVESHAGALLGMMSA